jgi:allophanate hydrolase
MMTALHTLADWRQAYADGLRPADLLTGLLEAFDAADPAWIWRATPQFVLDQLAALPPAPDASTPLWGVPFAVKDNIDVAGIPTTGACPAFAYVPAHSAVAVERLRAAGAILVGKTNLDQFATGLVGTRSPYGEVPNTFDPRYVSGGSSSGSASVVARGLVPFALGTDTAGSGRVPAGFNNLVGLKPTPGSVPMGGVLPACRSLDVVSVLALTVADAAQVMALFEGARGEARFNEPVLQPDWLGRGGRAPRLGVPARPGCDPALGWDRAFDEAAERARALGAELVEIDFTPLFEVARLLYEGPWVAERHLVAEALLASDPDAIDPVVRGIMESADWFDGDAVFSGRYRLEELRARIAPMWDAVDALMVPTAVTCPTRAAVALEPLLRNAELGLYTNFVNLLGLAALALPSHVAAAGIPFGVTFIGPGGSDAALVRWGLEWERAGPATLGARLRETRVADRTPGRMPLSAPVLQLAVVGAHLEGMPLHAQLTERGCRLVARTRTAAAYRLYALPDTAPPKPGLARMEPARAGYAIDVEVYAMPQAGVGSFLALIPPPLGLGSLELADGRWIHGFICEPHALAGALDISVHGGWRAWVASR